MSCNYKLLSNYFCVKFLLLLLIMKENHVHNHTDGMHEGIQYFKSHDGRGKFVRLLALQPDKRFVDSTIQQETNGIGSSTQIGAPKEYNHEYMTVSYVCVMATK